MAKNFDHLSHIKSRLIREIENGEFYGLTPTVDNSDEQGSSPIKLNLAKRPTAENLIEGEIAVNYLKRHETLTIKNTENEIVGFVNENEFNQAQEIVASALAQEKQERISDIASIKSQVGNVEGVTDEIQSDIEELEHTVSAALNDLNDRIGDGTSSIAGINDRIDDVIEDVNEQFEQLDLNIEDMELIISSSLNDLNTRIISVEENAIQQNLDNEEKFNEIELVVSSSLNDLNSRLEEKDEIIAELRGQIADLTARVEALEA